MTNKQKWRENRDGEESDEDMGPGDLIAADNTFDPTSLNSVLGLLLMLLSNKPMLGENIPETGHILC